MIIIVYSQLNKGKTMDDYFVPISIQGDLQDRANFFMNTVIPKASWRLWVDARGKFIYIRRVMDDGTFHNLGRLIYSGDPENMSFAIYRYRTEKYDSKNDFIGAHHLNGTLEGALKAIFDTYP